MADGGFDPAVSPLRVFGAMLRFYRTQAGLSQTDLGARVHFSGDLVSKIEMGQRIATEEYRVLKRWKRVGVPPDTLKPIVCVECHTPCQPGWTHCRTCGAMFLLDRARGRVLPRGAAKKLFAIWASVMILGVGVPAVTALPTAACVVAIVAFLAIIGAIVYLAFRPVQDQAY